MLQLLSGLEKNIWLKFRAKIKLVNGDSGCVNFLSRMSGIKELPNPIYVNQSDSAKESTSRLETKKINGGQMETD